MDHLKGLTVSEYHDTTEAALAAMTVEEKELPQISGNEVLIKMDAAPCNPSDLMFISGRYGVSKPLPTIPGWEGSGTVIKSASLMTKWLVGRRVACGGQNDNDGTWASHYVTNGFQCIPLSSKLSRADAAAFIVNPLTAYAMLSVAHKKGHKTIVKTAAASQLGRLVNVFAPRFGIEVINVIRREEQIGVLKDLGAIHFINQSDSDFSKQFRSKAKEMKASLVMEAVGGELAGKIYKNMPPNSEVSVYGGLSEQPVSNIDLIELIFRNKTLSGFYLGHWMKNQNPMMMIKASRFISKHFLDGSITTSVQAETGFEGAAKALLDYSKNMTAGKVLIVPEL